MRTLLAPFAPTCALASILLILTGCGSNQIMSRSTLGSQPTGPAPTVLAVAEQVNGVAPNRMQEVQFSEAMDPATINGSTFVVTDAGGNRMPGAIAYDATFHIASFQPEPALEINTKYTAAIATGVKSAGGVPIARPYIYSFTTRDDSDKSPLSVINVSPFPDQSCVSDSTKIVITFSEEPDASQVNSQSIVVTGPSGEKIPVTLALNVAATQVVVTPTEPLPEGSITVTVSNIGDLAGQMMSQPFTWTFTTACG